MTTRSDRVVAVVASMVLPLLRLVSFDYHFDSVVVVVVVAELILLHSSRYPSSLLDL